MDRKKVWVPEMKTFYFTFGCGFPLADYAVYKVLEKGIYVYSANEITSSHLRATGEGVE